MKTVRIGSDQAESR